ncbi:M56 family metallopeptidase [Streptomyces sp. J2-1]|uniref:M56 family metallopeptidase n=1 Tax=Streptomyces corallincola TaxID=2851888 RepID=UPI001C38E71D|nr:M56 family metallopeptidase [Streptomyces corallincola]MBV2352855.1 M56 family metallopeptidase [Streptomyces corallincola]
MMVPVALLLLGALTAVVAPRSLARADWRDREPVVALWVWQCVVVAVLLCCALSMTLSAAAAWDAVRAYLFASAPRAVVDAYALGTAGPWAAATAIALALGGVWTLAMLVREVLRARTRRRRRRTELLVRAPLLPGEESEADRLVVLEGERPDAWWLSGPAPRLVVTTAALRRLKGRQLDALLAHEQGHDRARHHWLLHCSAALAGGFPQVPVFAAFRDEMHRLVELAADDMASRRFGRRTTALALVELNEDRGVFGPSPAPGAQLRERVDRLLTPADRLPAVHRLRLTAAGALVPVVPCLVALVPGLHALG